jgi:hypothetical protein
MHYVNPLAATVIECLDAVRLTGDPAMLMRRIAGCLVPEIALQSEEHAAVTANRTD